ncbi:MAG: DNA-binding HxlR family transcriptional regulator [Glaciecola sp.]|jgi:DNA-binding HxlR family transcriptional regulator|uniref:winged helix-turn-helix transcriptional regulator n=1 Tax=Congregibacter sp. TaxID=2744308 RepID=UPI0039E5226F
MTKKHVQTCPIAEFLNTFGDAWTLLVIREAFYGSTRFGEFLKNTGMAKNILSNRLTTLLDEGVLRRVDIGERGARYEYHLTDKGESLITVLVAINQWANEQMFAKGREAVNLCARSSGRKLPKLVPRDHDGKVLAAGDILAKAGPGASAAAKERINAIPVS